MIRLYTGTAAVQRLYTKNCCSATTAVLLLLYSVRKYIYMLLLLLYISYQVTGVLHLFYFTLLSCCSIA